MREKSDVHERASDSDCLVALEAAGADPNTMLTSDEREHLRSQGYLNLGQLMTSEQCEEAKRRIHAQIEVEEEGIPFSKGSDGDGSSAVYSVAPTPIGRLRVHLPATLLFPRR